MRKVGRVVATYEATTGHKVNIQMGNLLEFPRHDPAKGSLQYGAILNSWVNLQEIARLQGKDGVFLSFYLDGEKPATTAQKAAVQDLDDDIPF